MKKLLIALMFMSGIYANAEPATGTINPYSILKVNPSASMLVRIISFAGESKHATTLLNWTSENEQMVDRYEVQRGSDPSVFTTIGTVQARKLTSWQYYDYEDRSALKGITFYRLKIIDHDDRVSYSRVIAVSVGTNDDDVFVIQNPVQNMITVLNQSGKQGKFDFRLSDMTGLEILKGNTSMSHNGGMAIPVPAQIKAGIYILEITGLEVIFREKLLIGR